MTEPRQAIAADERPLYFSNGRDGLFGILTRPTGAATRAGFVILAGGGVMSTNRNRLSVRFCRRMAAHGYHAVRFDYHGIGESEGRVDEDRLDRPFTEDLKAVLPLLRAEGVDRFVLVGSCFGSRTVLASAPDIEGLDQVVLLASPPIDLARGEAGATRMAFDWGFGRYMRRALNPRVLRGMLDGGRRRIYAKVLRAKWRVVVARVRRRRSSADLAGSGGASPAFLEPLEAILRKGVRVLMLYGEDDEFYRYFLRAREGRLGRVLDRAGSAVEVRVLSGQVHGFTRVAVQDTVLDVVSSWLVGDGAQQDAGPVAVAAPAG